MAVLSRYKCEKCGYEVYADKHGHYALMMGECYLFRCPTCKEIVEILADDEGIDISHPCCPNCGVDSDEELYSWNPIEGRCPKCEGKMAVDENAPILLVD